MRQGCGVVGSLNDQDNNENDATRLEDDGGKRDGNWKGGSNNPRTGGLDNRIIDVTRSSYLHNKLIHHTPATTVSAQILTTCTTSRYAVKAILEGRAMNSHTAMTVNTPDNHSGSGTPMRLGCRDIIYCVSRKRVAKVGGTNFSNEKDRVNTRDSKTVPGATLDTLDGVGFLPGLGSVVCGRRQC